MHGMSEHMTRVAEAIRGRVHADIGAEQLHLQFFEEIGIDVLATEQQRRQAAGEVAPGLGESGAQTGKQAVVFGWALRCGRFRVFRRGLFSETKQGHVQSFRVSLEVTAIIPAIRSWRNHTSCRFARSC